MLYNKTIILILLFIGVASGVLLYKKTARKAVMQKRVVVSGDIQLYTEDERAKDVFCLVMVTVLLFRL